MKKAFKNSSWLYQSLGYYLRFLGRRYFLCLLVLLGVLLLLWFDYQNKSAIYQDNLAQSQSLISQKPQEKVQETTENWHKKLDSSYTHLDFQFAFANVLKERGMELVDADLEKKQVRLEIQAKPEKLLEVLAESMDVFAFAWSIKLLELSPERKSQGLRVILQLKSSQ